MLPFAGRLPATLVHVLPKSVVLNRYGFQSSVLCASTATYAVPGSKCEGSMREISAYGLGAPGMLAYTLVKVSPLFWLTCRLPSSVPIQITPGRDGDSRTCVVSELAE